MKDIEARNIETPFPGCLGGMVKMFNFSNGLARDRLLTDKPHCDGDQEAKGPYLSLLPRSSPDVTSTSTAPPGVESEDQTLVSEFRRSLSSKKTDGTLMKTLIAQEMSKELQLKNKCPNVVAKLMGLEDLPQHHFNSEAKRSHSKCSSRRSLSHLGSLKEYWETQLNFLENKVQCETHLSQKHDEYKDVYETCHHVYESCHHSQKTTIGDVRPQKGRYDEHIYEKKMALVRQKFIEAKYLSTSDKGSQSKEFQDALEVLSSHEDILLKFLQESNSMFSRDLYGMNLIPTPSETKRITVLKPSNVITDEKLGQPEKRSVKQTKKPNFNGQAIGRDKTMAEYFPSLNNLRVDEYPASSTRIVVLKPSPGKAHVVKAAMSPPSSLQKMSSKGDFDGEPKDDGAQEIAKEITCQMPVSDQRDDTNLSSVFSNGYIGDDSSVNKSENDGEDVENLSDSEIMSPTYRHSWDYINRFGSPCSSSSFSRTSCSIESSVCREAKKRLSERFALMTANENFQDQTKVRRSSSTLGEMLALSDTMKSVKSENETPETEHKLRESTSFSNSNLNVDSVADSPKQLPRSKSLPIPSAMYNSRLNIDTPDLKADRKVPKELNKTNSSKSSSSLRMKVSNLFLSRNKKLSNEKSGGSSSRCGSHSSTPEATGSQVSHPRISAGSPHCLTNAGLEECYSPLSYTSSSKATNQPMGDCRAEQDILSHEEVLRVARHLTPGKNAENQDQPSPISVLQPPFQDDNDTFLEISLNCKSVDQGRDAIFASNLIDKSPPIGSIARTLSWDDSCVETTTAYTFNRTSVSSREKEEHDWRLFIRTLLSEAGFTDNAQPDQSCSRRPSLESPLDPSLREKYASENDNELHEAKRRRRRSNRKLVFDFVSAALSEITGYKTNTNTRAIPSANKFTDFSTGIVEDHLWSMMKDWFCSEVKYSYEDDGDTTSMMVEEVLRKELMGRWWIDNMRVEADNLGKEIEGKLLEELMEEAVAAFVGRIQLTPGCFVRL